MSRNIEAVIWDLKCQKLQQEGKKGNRPDLYQLSLAETNSPPHNSPALEADAPRANIEYYIMNTIMPIPAFPPPLTAEQRDKWFEDLDKRHENVPGYYRRRVQ